MKIRFFTLFSMLMLVVMVFSACAPAATPTPEKVVETVVVEKEKVVEKTVEVQKVVTANVITYNSYNGDPKPRAFDESVVKMWNEAHPEMPVEHSIIAHEDFKQAIRAYLTADPAPDVLTWFAGNRARFFIDKGLILDQTKMWEDAKLNEVYAPGFQALATYNDKKYFLPTSYYWWAIYYRKSLFAEAGIEKEPETWQDLLDACDKLNAKGITPITIGARFKWPAAAWFDYLNMRVNGPQFHIDLTDLKVPYTDPKVRKVFDYWKELIDHKCFIEDPAAYDWQEAIDPMVQGKAAMYLMGAFITDSYPDEAEADLDFFRFPIIDPNLPVGEDAPTDGYFASATARNPEGALAFMAFLGSKEVQQKAFEELGRLPTRTDVDISKATPATQKGIKLIQSADYIAQFYDRDTTPPMAEAGMDGFMRFWDDPTQIDQILADLEAERQRILSEGQ
ncbi:ABC transporter substrate-binding protein [Anaerolinea thermophila]|uniref:ABC transporter substrate binding protein n=2 Tax=Anaerolinea TaxID=233189 RepID=E8N0U9_ANATU|nr:ABC transporter substrate-binding protein [Anaerolinea thermophila]BAJ62494.1 putative ABC transporter substrate binding protein [Anaerolinea thermophila UNI-1]